MFVNSLWIFRKIQHSSILNGLYKEIISISLLIKKIEIQLQKNYIWYHQFFVQIIFEKNYICSNNEFYLIIICEPSSTLTLTLKRLRRIVKTMKILWYSSWRTMFCLNIKASRKDCSKNEYIFLRYSSKRTNNLISSDCKIKILWFSFVVLDRGLWWVLEELDLC